MWELESRNQMSEHYWWTDEVSPNYSSLNHEITLFPDSNLRFSNTCLTHPCLNSTLFILKQGLMTYFSTCFTLGTNSSHAALTLTRDNCME